MRVIACKNRDTGLWCWWCPACHYGIDGYTNQPTAARCADHHARGVHQ